METTAHTHTVDTRTGSYTEQDIEFLRHGDEPLVARLYRPTGDGPFPAVVNVHGGAWNRGDRLNNEVLSRALAASGIVVMAPDFRMPPAGRYPEPVADINFAIRWMKRHAADFGATPERVGGVGFSSGGHQLALAALRPDDSRYNRLPLPDGDDFDAQLAFLILCYAVLDPVARYAMVRREGIEKLIDSHHNYWQDEAAMREGSPQQLIETGVRVALPPALVIQGTVDDNLTPDMASRFGEAYRAAGGHVFVLRYEDAPHGFMSHRVGSPAEADATRRIIEFVRTQGGEA
jgi:acetyl esterase